MEKSSLFWFRAGKTIDSTIDTIDGFEICE